MDRRVFLQGAGGMAVVGAVAPWGVAASAPGGVGFVASNDGRVHGFCRDGDGWRRTAAVRSERPAALALSPDRRFLYVANAVGTFEQRPVGSVEAFAVEGNAGRLRAVNRTGLALFATTPRLLAVSPNGRWLAVGMEGGGYNLLPLAEDGSVGRVTASLRLLGAVAVADEALVFAEERTLLAVRGERAMAMSVGEDGSLDLQPESDFRGTERVGSAAREDVAAGLRAAAERVGIRGLSAVVA